MNKLSKILKHAGMISLSVALLAGGIPGLATRSVAKARANYIDIGTYVMDLSKGPFVLPEDVYQDVKENIESNKHNGTISYKYALVEDRFVVGESLDLDNNGDFDVYIDYGNRTTEIYSKLDTCNIKDSYALKCSPEEIYIPKKIALPAGDAGLNELDDPIEYDGPTFYGTILFKFVSDEPEEEKNPEVITDNKNNPEVSSDTASPTATVQEVKENIDSSMKVPSLNKLSKSKKSIKASWKPLKKKALKSIDGIEVQCSTDKAFKDNVKTMTVKKNKTSVSFKKLKPGKKYFVQIRTFKTVNGEKVYSNWSKPKSAKIAKK